MRFTRKGVAVLAATGAIAMASVPALAQEEAETPIEETTTREELRAEHQAAFAEALAAELGIPVDEVSAALENVREQMQAERAAERRAALQERLDQAVADGDLTQEQADAILEAAEAGVFPGRGGHRGFGGPRGLGGFGGVAPSTSAA